MPEYLVIWQSDNGVVQSHVETENMPQNEKGWVCLAAKAEDMTPEQITEMLNEPGGFILYAVIKGPVHFIY